MNFRQFEALYWIARLGSFHAAARHLETSQPAVSARIRELEHELGVALFDRSARKARLTAERPRTHRAMPPRSWRSPRKSASASARKEALAGHVRLGVPGIAAMTWLPRAA